MSLWSKFFGPPDRDGFARLVTKTLRDAGEDRALAYEPEAYQVRLGRDSSSDTGLLSLENLYREYVAASRSERRELLRRVVALARVTEDGADEASFEEVRADLLPRVVSRTYLELSRLQLRVHAASPENAVDATGGRPFSEHLAVTLVHDLPDTIQTVAGHMLAKWGVTIEDAMKVATENLWSRSNEDFRPLGPGLWASPWQDTHDASRLFLHDLVWQLPVTGRHVAMVPNRNLLLVCGDEDADALVRMAELTDRQVDEPRPLSAVAVRLDGSTWVPFLPPPGHPALWPLKRCAMKLAAVDHEEQKRLLEALYEKTGEDVFVASHVTMEREDGTLYTWTSWVAEVTDALMPRADVVAFSPPGGDEAPAVFADWDRVVAVAGDLLELTDLYPTRYRARRFPTDEQLRAMGARQTP